MGVTLPQQKCPDKVDRIQTEELKGVLLLPALTTPFSVYADLAATPIHTSRSLDVVFHSLEKNTCIIYPFVKKKKESYIVLKMKKLRSFLAVCCLVGVYLLLCACLHRGIVSFTLDTFPLWIPRLLAEVVASRSLHEAIREPLLSLQFCLWSQEARGFNTKFTKLWRRLAYLSLWLLPATLTTESATHACIDM